MNLTKAITIIANKLDERYPNLKTAFKVIDSDGDGFINFGEFNRGLMNMKVNIPKHDIETVFKYLDKNQDG